MKSERVGESTNQLELDHFRSRIDHIDSEIIKLLGERVKIVREVGIFKKAKGISVMQQERVRVVLESRVAAGSKVGLSAEFVRKVWSALIDEACRLEEGSN